MTHICVGNLTIIGSDNVLSPGRREAIIWTNDGILLIRPLYIIRNKLQWNCNRNSNIFIQDNAFENIVCEMAAILSRPHCVNMQEEIDDYTAQKHRMENQFRRIEFPCRLSQLRIQSWHKKVRQLHVLYNILKGKPGPETSQYLSI